MPEHIAVCCYACATHQVVQRRKATTGGVSKWECRMCRAKQSVTNVYATGAQAAPLRSLVQELNMRAGRQREAPRERPPSPVPVMVKWDQEWGALLSESSSSDGSADADLLRPPERGRPRQPARPTVARAKRRAVSASDVPAIPATPIAARQVAEEEEEDDEDDGLVTTRGDDAKYQVVVDEVWKDEEPQPNREPNRGNRTGEPGTGTD